MLHTNDSIYPDLQAVTAPFKGVLLDAYGVFWGGNDVGLFPGSLETLTALVDSGKKIGILSNSSQLASSEIEKLSKHGLFKGEHYHFLITSGEVAREVFREDKLPFQTANKTFWVCGDIHPKYHSHPAIFKGTAYRETEKLNEADFIYVAVPHIDGKDQTDPELFRESIQKLVKSHLPMVCVNPDHFAHEGKPACPVVRQGAIAAMYEELGGEVFYIGKPAKIAYAAAMQHFISYGVSNPSKILMVGDLPETDIRGARMFGMSSALIMDTGIMADRIAKQGFDKAIQQLALSDSPEFLIKTLAPYGI